MGIDEYITFENHEACCDAASAQRYIQGQRDMLAKVIREARKRRDRARREAKGDDHTWLIGHADVADQLHRDIADLAEVAAGRQCECGHYVFAHYLGPGNDCEPCRECDCDDYSEVTAELLHAKAQAPSCE